MNVVRASLFRTSPSISPHVAGSPRRPASGRQASGAATPIAPASPAVAASASPSPGGVTDAASAEAALRMAARTIVPSLAELEGKGAGGRVGVVGGSADYAGAPYFAAISALRAGSDLVYVACAESSAIPIKCYSPELMVHPLLPPADASDADAAGRASASRITALFPRLHVVVIGPGLGRGAPAIAAATEVVRAARAAGLGLVLDADGLGLLSSSPSLLSGYTRAIVTPNAPEFGRLAAALGVTLRGGGAGASPGRGSDDDNDADVMAVAAALGGPTVVRKGAVDLIASGGRVLRCGAWGSPRRAGGQGDLLSGTLATWLAWSLRRERLRGWGGEGAAPAASASLGGWADAPAATAPTDGADIALAAFGACSVVRRAAAAAYAQRRRSMLASDVIEHLGPAFDELFGGD